MKKKIIKLMKSFVIDGKKKKKMHVNRKAVGAGGHRELAAFKGRGGRWQLERVAALWRALAAAPHISLAFPPSGACRELIKEREALA